MFDLVHYTYSLQRELHDSMHIWFEKVILASIFWLGLDNNCITVLLLLLLLLTLTTRSSWFPGLETRPKCCLDSTFRHIRHGSLAWRPSSDRPIDLTSTLNCSKDARLPVQLQRAMAAEAEAAREARAKVRRTRPTEQNRTGAQFNCSNEHYFEFSAKFSTVPQY